MQLASAGTVDQTKIDHLKQITDREIVSFAVLYGSQATGDATDASDIDIGLYLDGSVPENRIQTLLFRIEGEYTDAGFDDTELDFSILSDPAPTQFITTVKEQALFLSGDRQACESWVTKS